MAAIYTSKAEADELSRMLTDWLKQPAVEHELTAEVDVNQGFSYSLWLDVEDKLLIFTLTDAAVKKQGIQLPFKIRAKGFAAVTLEKLQTVCQVRPFVEDFIHQSTELDLATWMQEGVFRLDNMRREQLLLRCRISRPIIRTC